LTAGILLQLVGDLARSRSSSTEELSSRRFDVSRLAPGYEAIQAAILLIMSKFSEELALEDVLAVSHMSKANFSRRFLAYTGKTFTEFLNDVRIDYACQKLLGTDESVGEIAFTSGYHNLSHFTACFAAIAAPHRPTTARPVLNRSDRPTGTCSPSLHVVAAATPLSRHRRSCSCLR
jgi:AraC-like DNA-binding protein